eukprot:TRINITY_DN602_c0_g2_i1.p1 TRINITY_DN602_c0_g2~~TRINITY_DN602_c0_g2_i1.p1  ORF type:complete len:572 (-),score=50.94 TRINITY_DN602_c0_g2_i1:31-1746(-)
MESVSAWLAPDLPRELLRHHLLCHITDNLDIRSCRLVCKAWSAVLWLHVHVPEPNKFPNLDFSQLPSVLAKATSLSSHPLSLSVVLGALVGNTTIRKLDLEGCFSSSENPKWKDHIRDLAHLTQIERLSLRNGSIRDSEAKEIERILSNLPKLTAFNVSVHLIGRTGMVPISFALASTCSSLTKLNLCGNQIQSGGVIELARGIFRNTTLKSLDISNNFVSAHGFAALGFVLLKNTTLTELNVASNDSEDSRAMSQFLRATNHHITKLNLSNCHLRDDCLPALQDLLLPSSRATSLTHLELSALEFSEQRSYDSLFGEILRSNTTLRHLALQPCPQNALHALSLAVSGNTTLTSLVASVWPSGQASSVDFRHLFLSCTSLRKLDISRNTVSSESIQGLGALLRLSTCLQELRACDMKELFSIEPSPLICVDEFAAGVRDTKSLKKLCIDFSYLSSDKMSFLMGCLQGNMTLTSLELETKSPASPQAIGILESLQDHPSLVHLSLKHGNISADLVRKIIRAASSMPPRMQRVDLGSIKAYPEQLELFARIPGWNSPEDLPIEFEFTALPKWM